MKPVHFALAILMVVIWGLAFVFTKVGLDSFSPPLLAAIRFVVAAVAVLFVARPAFSWSLLIWIGMTLFVGQFLFQFFGIAYGVPVGLAAVIVQSQALFTVVFAVLLGIDRPTFQQMAGICLAAAGLACIAATVGEDFDWKALALIMISPISFAIGNLILRRAGQANAFNVIAWASLVPPLPCLALALWMEGPAALGRSLAEATWLGWFSAVYLGLIATSIAYVIWGDLLRHYSSAVVAPFALFVPFVGAGASYVVFSERFGPMRLAGMALVLLGLAFVLIPAPWLLRSNLYRSRG
jgi:O-acetylserine/cysteine efflux transporter